MEFYRNVRNSENINLFQKELKTTGENVFLEDCKSYHAVNSSLLTNAEN